LKRWQACTSSEAIQDLAAELGVSRESLERLDVTRAPERAAWAFPMHDDRRQVVGIRLRGSQGQKFALSGSHAGVFLPRGLDSRSTLLICEGPTDTAAALTLGYQAVGRPSCSGGTNILCDVLQAGRRRDVVILGDSDGPGRNGARQLADRIVGLVRSLKVITAAPHKDIREWLQAGVGRACVDVRINQASWYRVADPQNGDGRHEKWPARRTTW
jgi:5S rRNA maturation endonuclease (ribonuclease M5)